MPSDHFAIVLGNINKSDGHNPQSREMHLEEVFPKEDIVKSLGAKIIINNICRKPVLSWNDLGAFLNDPINHMRTA